MARIWVLLGAACALAACGQLTGIGEMGAPQSGVQASRFQSVGTCEPVAWQWLQDEAAGLPMDQRQQVELLLHRARDFHADFERGQCILALQQAERIVLESRGAPAS